VVRRIIKIDRVKCDGCGLCAEVCHEGAIAIVDGKATLLRDDYCDGMGNCLPVCPTGAIGIEEREAIRYDERAVRNNMMRHAKQRTLAYSRPNPNTSTASRKAHPPKTAGSELRQWPVKISLAPANSPLYENAQLLIAADCAAYAYDRFHADFIRGKITLIGCPKLDGADYGEKLTGIIRGNSVKSLTVVRMEVPCCEGIERVVARALKDSGKIIPLQAITISTKGIIVNSQA